MWGLRLSLALPFVTTPCEMLEMRCRWREPVRMDDARLIAALGQEPHTPLGQADKPALVGLAYSLASVN